MPGPLFYAAVKFQLHRELRQRNEDTNLVAHLDKSAIDAVAKATPGAVKAIGDGKIIDAILAFFASPVGQSLIAALMKLLLGSLVLAEPPKEAPHQE